jgi:hypothetical protein
MQQILFNLFWLDVLLKHLFRKTFEYHTISNVAKYAVPAVDNAKQRLGCSIQH